MKILLSSHFFHPSVGGIEQVSGILAHEFTKVGNEVKVVTTTAETGDTPFLFEVIRRPGALELMRLAGWCDVFFHNNISLQTAWPLLLVRRPWVIAHHTWLTRVDGRIGLRDRLKQRLIRHATNIAVSNAVAGHLSHASVVIGNPYRDDVFKLTNTGARARDLVFVGRLVSDKGADLLISALGILKQKGITPGLTVIGDGPERPALQQQARELGVAGRVEFAGARAEGEIAAMLNDCKIIVIPSRWEEPSGIVALEGIACGCAAIGAECGGLPDVIGKAGVTFPRGDAEALARKIETLLGDAVALERCRDAAKAQLRDHSAAAVARKYLDVLEGALR